MCEQNHFSQKCPLLCFLFWERKTHNVDKHDGANDLQEMRVADDSLGDVYVVEDPVHAEVLCHDIADHEHEANVEGQWPRDANTLNRDIETQDCGDVQHNEADQFETAEQRTGGLDDLCVSMQDHNHHRNDREHNAQARNGNDDHSDRRAKLGVQNSKRRRVRWGNVCAVKVHWR